MLAAGGGGIAFAQLAKSDAEVHFFTALGADDGARVVRERLAARPGVFVHAAARAVPHPRVVVMIDAAGRRTIIVADEPLQATADDALPWDVLAACDVVYFTGADPRVLAKARAAKRLVVTARRSPVLLESGVRADVVVGSVADPRENADLETYAPPPGALVLTNGPNPIRVARPDQPPTLVPAPERVVEPKGDYGAGDTFAAALAWFVASGVDVEEAARRAGPYGAAVLSAVDPLEAQLRLA